MRLVRILREGKYWLGPFIEYLLSANANCGTTKELSINDVFNEFEQIKKLCSWNEPLDRWKREAAQLLEIHGRRYWPFFVDQKAGREIDVMFDNDFAELVKLWRKDYPAPKPRRVLEQLEKSPAK